jgi:uncharacterized protein (UPF0548 family)
MVSARISVATVRTRRVGFVWSTEQTRSMGSRIRGLHQPRTLMILFRKPSSDAIQNFRAAQSKLDFTYPAVGATGGTPPAGYVVDHTRARLGEGEAVFQAAKAALARWEQFQLGWVEATPTDTPLQPGSCVAVVARIFGVWWLNACRIVYVVDENGPMCRFGFAYGTLPDHAESGEERFLIEWNRTDDCVSYDILAFSRPSHLLARLGYPVARRMQKRFAHDSVAVMQKAVGSTSGS